MVVRSSSGRGYGTVVAAKVVLRALMVSRIDLEADVRHSLSLSCYGRRVGAIRSCQAYPDMLCTISLRVTIEALLRPLASWAPAVRVFRVWLRIGDWNK
jgi:hypothetical protein